MSKIIAETFQSMKNADEATQSNVCNARMDEFNTVQEKEEEGEKKRKKTSWSIPLGLVHTRSDFDGLGGFVFQGVSKQASKLV